MAGKPPAYCLRKSPVMTSDVSGELRASSVSEEGTNGDRGAAMKVPQEALENEKKSVKTMRSGLSRRENTPSYFLKFCWLLSHYALTNYSQPMKTLDLP